MEFQISAMAPSSGTEESLSSDFQLIQFSMGLLKNEQLLTADLI